MLNNLKQSIYIISGPTAIGKSSLALRLADRINGTIINADSMQIYSNLKILTARPSSEDHTKVNHELYGYVDGVNRYNVSNWCNEIVKVISLNEKNNIPSIIVGGTGMYIYSLLNGLTNIPPILEGCKKESEKLYNKIGNNKFIKIIKEFDSPSLDIISTNDSSRLRRIWEVFNSTGTTLSEWKKKENKIFLNNAPYKILLFTPPRDEIYINVNKRFEKMIEQGAIDEVKKLNNLNLNLSLPIMRAHGVPEISNYLENKITIGDCIDKGQQVTRNYVKRQLTWWRSSRLSINQTFIDFPNRIDENLIKI